MADPIQQFYQNYDEEGRLTASQHGQVEFLTTMRYVEKYLFPGARILEIGAGTGRYSHTLAKAGYSVDAVELVPHNITIFESKTTPNEQITIRQGDARDLTGIADAQYDLTLILGPLYHLFTEADKRKAIEQALRVTKPGGVIFAAYCMSDASILDSGFRRKAFSVADFIEKGWIDRETFQTTSAPELVFELVRTEQIDELISVYPVERLHFVAVNLFTNHMREEVDQMDAETFALYLNYHFSICERKDVLGLSHHGLDVFRKNNG